MRIDNIISKKIEVPFVVWKWASGCSQFICLLQFLLNLCNIQSFLRTGFFYRFLTTATEIQSVFFQDLCLTKIFCSDLSQCFITLPAHPFCDPHFPPFWSLLQVLPVKNISSFTDQ